MSAKNSKECFTIEHNINDLNKVNGLLKMQPVALDLVDCLLGEQLGAGVYRSVFVFNINPEKVIKVEPLNTQCNVQEYLAWNQIQHLTGPLEWVKDWFAPVHWISPNGRVLCMARTDPYSTKKKPAEIPKFLWDVKEENFGWLNGKYVCHDYGSIYAFMDFKKGFQKVGERW